MPRPTPTGGFHTFTADQIFFSTTDDKGVIREANQTFVDLAHYSPDELLGAAHNIIRHPSMPRGAFYAMWSTLQAGKPFAAYVRNLAGNGSAYDVFATVTPLPDGGYLSVRTKPLNKDVHDLAHNQIYPTTLAAEHILRENGHKAAEAAEKGAENLLTQLEELNFDSYEQFQNVILPDEILRRENASEGLLSVEPTSPELAKISQAVHSIFRGLDQWMTEQASLEQLSQAIRRCSTRLRANLESAHDVSRSLDTLKSAHPELVGIFAPIGVWLQMSGIVSQYTDKIVATIESLDRSNAETRASVALARLHTTVMISFIGEISDTEHAQATQAIQTTEAAQTTKAAQHAKAALKALCQALIQGISAMEEQNRSHQSQASNAGGAIDSIVSIMEIPQALARDWQDSIKGAQLDPEAQALAESMRSSIEGTDAAIAELQELKDRVARVGANLSTRDLRDSVDTIASWVSEQD
nr:PAS domain-containing protein [Corynebacterium lactis]